MATTLTLSLASTVGNRSKTFTFPDAAAQTIMTAATNLYPAANVGLSLDAWFTQIASDLRDQVLTNARNVASATAAQTIPDIPLT